MTGPQFGRLKTLIADTRRLARMLSRTVLQAIGVQRIHEASDGNSGFARILECNRDIIPTDFSIERIDGIEFARKIRRSPDTPDPFVPIVRMTGHTAQARIEAARDAGVTEFLAKPVTAPGLLQCIIKILDSPRPFIRCDAFFGADRRRRVAEYHTGPWPRWNDPGASTEIA